jgi:hypothetical protein
MSLWPDYEASLKGVLMPLSAIALSVKPTGRIGAVEIGAESPPTATGWPRWTWKAPPARWL